METPTAEEVALLNSCLRAITEDGSDIARIANNAGVTYSRAQRALDVLEADGIVYSTERVRKRYRLNAEAQRPEPDFDPSAGMPWCDQCDCYHYASAPCIDEIAYCKRCGEHHTHPVCAEAR